MYKEPPQHLCRVQDVEGSATQQALSQANVEAAAVSRLQTELACSSQACQMLQDKLDESQQRWLQSHKRVLNILAVSYGLCAGLVGIIVVPPGLPIKCSALHKTILYSTAVDVFDPIACASASLPVISPEVLLQAAVGCCRGCSLAVVSTLCRKK